MDKSEVVLLRRFRKTHVFIVVFHIILCILSYSLIRRAKLKFKNKTPTSAAKCLIRDLSAVSLSRQYLMYCMTGIT